MPTATVKPNVVIMRIADIALRYGVSYRTVTTWHLDGTIPKGRYLPRRAWPFWYQHEIEANENRQRRLKNRRAAVTAPPLPKIIQPQFGF